MTNLKHSPTDPWTAPIHLIGRQLILEPLTMKHLDDLAENLLYPNAWHSVHFGLKTREDIAKGIAKFEQARIEKNGNGFAMVLKSTGEAVGRSHFMNFNRTSNAVEIGATWISQKWQKSFVNTEAKFLMLGYAFETMKCQRVGFWVDSLNFNSQRAVLRIGAKFEGELRNTVLLPDGRKRDYRVYSILDTEWPNVKQSLTWYLEKYV